MIAKMFLFSLVGIFFRKDVRRITYIKSEYGSRYCIGLGSHLTFKDFKDWLAEESEEPKKLSFKDRINIKRLQFGADLSRDSFRYWLNAHLFRIYFLEDIAIGHREEDASTLHINSINLNFLKWLKRRCDYSCQVWAIDSKQ